MTITSVIGTASGSVDPSDPEASIPKETAERIRLLLQEAQERLLFRKLAVGAALLVMVAMLWAGHVVIRAFTNHVEAATSGFVLADELPARPATSAASQASPPAQQGSAVPQTAAGPGTQASGLPASAPTVGHEPVARTQTKYTIDLAAIANSVVAVITVIAAAIVVLVLGLVRATMALRHPSERDHPGSPTSNDSPIPPTIIPEVIKSAGEALSTIIGKLPSR